MICPIKIYLQEKRVLESFYPIKKHRQGVVVSKRNNIFIFHDKNNSLIARGLVYEPEIQDKIKLLIEMDILRKKGHGGAFYDIGANIGLHTAFVSDQFKDTKIIAFDPSPYSWKYLESTIKYNNLNQVTLHKCALSDKNGVIDFCTWGSESSGDSIRDTGRTKGLELKKISVESVKLDDFIKDMPPPGVIKLDTEGAELLIFQGSIHTINKYRPMIISEFFEENRKAFNVSTDDIFNFLQLVNYSLFSLELQKLDKDSFDISQKNLGYDYILLPNELFH